MNSITYSKSIPVKKQYDVIVCGGGVAGVAAAVGGAFAIVHGAKLLKRKSEIMF